MNKIINLYNNNECDNVYNFVENVFENARRNFFMYCLLLNPKLYTKRRNILKPVCDALQESLNKRNYTLMINLPPRSAKSTTISLFITWVLGNNQHLSILRATYAQTLTLENHIIVINTMRDALYKRIFPNIPRLETCNRVSLRFENHHRTNLFNTSVRGVTTGFGGDIIITDDLYNGHLDALSPRKNESVITWYYSNFQSRLDGDIKLNIIVGTVWGKNELAGQLLTNKFVDKRIYIPALQIKDNQYVSFCDDVITTDELIRFKNTMPDIIFETMYQQNFNVESSRIIKDLKPFEITDFENIYLYDRVGVLDTKSTGTDYLALAVFDIFVINYDEFSNQEVQYIIVLRNALYYDTVFDTKQENELIQFIKDEKIQEIHLETNFDNTLYRNLRDKCKCKVISFRSDKNKIAKIITNARFVNEFFIVKDINPILHQFINDVYNYNTGSKHDDAIDVLSMSAEIFKHKYIKM